MGEGVARPGEEGLSLGEGELQRQGEGHGGGLGGLVAGVGPDLGEELPVDIRLLVALHVGQALLIDELQQCGGKALVQLSEHIVQVPVRRLFRPDQGLGPLPGGLGRSGWGRLIRAGVLLPDNAELARVRQPVPGLLCPAVGIQVPGALQLCFGVGVVDEALNIPKAVALKIGRLVEEDQVDREIVIGQKALMASVATRKASALG